MSLRGVKHVEYKRRHRPEAPVSAWKGESQFSVFGGGGYGRSLEAFRYFVGNCQLGQILRLAESAGNAHAKVA